MRRTGVRRAMLGVSGATTVALGAFLVAAPSAGADSGSGGGGGGDTKRIRMYDDCEPKSFNAAVGPGTCVGKGRTTFDDLVAQLTSSRRLVANESAEDWEFKPGTVRVDRGDRLRAVNRGGEFHTFTKVAKFGGGCVPAPFLNFGLPPVKECQDPAVFETTGVPPGRSLDVARLPVGKHRFECLIHPWMRTTVTVRPDDHSGHG